jgi:anti-sigma28 factor (negative regulator of flagellin synthesis)
MSSINGLGGNAPIQPAQNIAPRTIDGADAPAGAPRAADRLELSGASGFLETLKTNGDVRADKVASVRSQIEAGTYETDGTKLDGALDGVLDDLLG